MSPDYQQAPPPDQRQNISVEVLRAVNLRLGAVAISTRRAAEGLRKDVREIGVGDANGRDRQIGELIAAVIERTEEVRETCEQLQAMVTRALGVPAPAPGEEVSVAAAQPPAADGAATRRPAESSGDPELVVTRMALAGASRAEIAAWLDGELEVQDADALVLAVLGSDGGGAGEAA